MQKIRGTIIAATVFALFYQLTPYIGFSDGAILALFAVSPFVVIWLAYRILKYGTPSTKTWDEAFYEDLPYQRNGKEELV